MGREEELESALLKCHTLSRKGAMTDTCKAHSGLEARMSNLENRHEKFDKKLDKVRVTQAGWSAVLALLMVGVPLAIKLLWP